MTTSYDHPAEVGRARKPVSGLVSDALRHVASLLRSEVALARAEIAAKARQAMHGGLLLAAAAVVALPSLFVLMLALAAFLIERGLAASLSCLITAVAGLAAAGLLAVLGMNRLKAGRLLPDRTINQLHRDAATIREHI